MATTIITKYGSGAPTADDLSVGELAVDLTNKRLYSKNSSSEVIELGVNAAADTTFGDNVKAIFGDGSDLQIYHDATDSIINDNGTGSLKLQQGGSTKLEVTTTGIDVTGTVTADGLTVDGTPVRFVSTAPMLNFMESGVTDSNHRLRQNAGNFVIQKLSDDEGTATDRLLIDGGTGDISFYEDTGTTAKLVWKASDERLGIGTTSPQQLLHINGGAADTAFQITNSASGSTATDGFSITVENPTPDVV